MEEVGTGAEEVDFVLGAAAADAVSVAEVEAGLSIEAEIGDLFGVAEQDFDLDGIRHDERAMAQ